MTERNDGTDSGGAEVEEFLIQQAGPDAGWSTCPICGQRWLVTPHRDCMMPACGCYGHDASAENPSRPCEPCGLAHAWRWVDRQRRDCTSPEPARSGEVS